MHYSKTFQKRPIYMVSVFAEMMRGLTNITEHNIEALQDFNALSAAQLEKILKHSLAQWENLSFYQEQWSRWKKQTNLNAIQKEHLASIEDSLRVLQTLLIKGKRLIEGSISQMMTTYKQDEAIMLYLDKLKGY